MNTFITTVCLSLGGVVAFAQSPPESYRAPATRTSSELQIGYVRETYKMRDLQASPMLYIANLNGVQVAYTRLTAKTQWRAILQAGVGDFIAPGLGIRPIKFLDEQEQPLWLVPTVYRGRIELEYRHLIHQRASHTGWLGIGLHDTFGYADGLVLSTWAINTVAISALYQSRLTLGRKHMILLEASLPVVAAVSRIPYSNVVSEPDRSNASTFLGGSHWTSLNQFLNPQVGVSYRFGLNRRVAFQASYQYNYLRYTEPRLIRTADHKPSLSFIYQFQRQTR